MPDTQTLLKELANIVRKLHFYNNTEQEQEKLRNRIKEIKQQFIAKEMQSK